jgi:hypothetical protein
MTYLTFIIYLCNSKDDETMKKIVFLFTILAVILVISCSKSNTTPDNTTGAEFKFISLVPQDTVLPVNGITNITATATGSGLTYKWTASYGSFIGSGSKVKWSVCHSDKFTITCDVSDGNGHSDSKTISINVH